VGGFLWLRNEKEKFTCGLLLAQAEPGPVMRAASWLPAGNRTGRDKNRQDETQMVITVPF